MKKYSACKGFLVLLALAICLPVLHSQTWGVVRVRGEIWVADELIEMGARMDSASAIRFSKNSDIMAVRSTENPEIFKLIRPENFVPFVSMGAPCSQETCAPEWIDPYFVSAELNRKKSKNKEEAELLALAENFNKRRSKSSLDKCWEGISGPEDPYFKSSENCLVPGGRLYPGDFLLSYNGNFQLKFKNNGNLTLSRLSPRLHLWATGTFGDDPGYFELRQDGNLAIFNSSGRQIWTTDIKDNGLGIPGRNDPISDNGVKYLCLLDNGNMQLMNTEAHAFWETRTFDGSSAFNSSGFYPPLLWRPLNNEGASYQIISALNDKPLEIPTTYSGKATSAKARKGEIPKHKHWTLKPQDNGFYVIQSNLGRVLTTEGDWGLTMAKPTNFWDQFNGRSQQWDLIPASFNEFYIRNPNGRYLIIKEGMDDKSANAKMFTLKEEDSRKWKFVPIKRAIRIN